MAEIVLKNITKRWGDFIGVNDQSLEVKDKEFLVLLGPSGCGKTTTMRMIAGLENPTSGNIYIGGKRVNDYLPKDRDVAMVFQNYGLYPHMTVYGNIAYPLKVRGVKKNSIEGKVRRAAEQVELLEFLKRKPKELSGGQRQRVALARAIVRQPEVFLMDEPLSNLDAKLRVTMRAELKHLSNKLQVTTIYVTHDQIEAMTLADRVAIMKEGVIQQLGTPDEVFNNPTNLFVADFIGSPSMNLLDGAVKNNSFIAKNGTTIAHLNCPNKNGVVLGVRANDVNICERGGGVFDAVVYACENTGENTFFTVKVGEQRLIIRAGRHLRKNQDDVVGIKLAEKHLYLFDATSSQRIVLQN